VCPTGALTHHALGFVGLEPDRCNGCGYCAVACPFDVPRLQRNALTGRGTATKCNFCQDRVTQGLMPACAKTCPTGAIRFGDRTAMVRLGEQRVATLREHGVAEASLYGATLLGGLGRMFVLAASPAAYGLPARPDYPFTIRLWREVVAPFGRLGVVAALIAVAMNAIVGWRLRRRTKDEEAPR
jgi:formate dehydrogenase iron-sulfur subunit